MVLKKNKTEELIVNPLYDIIKNEYGFKNVFFSFVLLFLWVC